MRSTLEEGRVIGVDEYERLARETLASDRWDWLAGGAAGARTLAANVAAFARRRLWPRTLVDVSAPVTTTSLPGRDLSMPLLVAPVGHQRLLHPDGERATATAAAAAGTVACLPMLSSTPLSDVVAAAPRGARWQQLYWLRDEGVMTAMIEAAASQGIEALVLTVDAPRRAQRYRESRSGFHYPPDLGLPDLAALLGEGRAGKLEDLLDAGLTWRRLERIVDRVPVPVLLKGVLTPMDARAAHEHGAAGIVVSNHGGRQLDGAPATLDALPGVADAVGGQLPVLLDGGVRSGVDVATALALGADAVMVGRPAMWGLVVAGARGVRDVFELLRSQLEDALALLGAPRADALGPSFVDDVPGGRSATPSAIEPGS